MSEQKESTRIAVLAEITESAVVLRDVKKMKDFAFVGVKLLGDSPVLAKGTETHAISYYMGLERAFYTSNYTKGRKVSIEGSWNEELKSIECEDLMLYTEPGKLPWS